MFTCAFGPSVTLDSQVTLSSFVALRVKSVPSIGPGRCRIA